jgi:hypothetical protein
MRNLAWAIAAGVKPYENRTWRTNYRGDVAIIAGQSRKSLDVSRAALRSLGIEPPAEDDLPFGAIVCVVTLVDCVPLAEVPRRERSPLVTGPWCWRLENIRRLRRPVACRGVLGLVDLIRAG